MNTSHLNSILLFLVALLAMPHGAFALSGSGSPAPACFQGSAKVDEVLDDPMSSSLFGPDPASVFLAPSREFIRPLVRAIRLHKEGDDNDAAELIGQFLADVGEEDFLVRFDKSKGIAVTVSRIAVEMLGSLPKSAIDSYRVRFGVPARQRLSLAIAESNYFDIAQVMQRYPYTDAGIEAAMLMGHHHFDAGRALLAAESFQTAHELGRVKGKPDSQLSVLTAVSWFLARRPELAEIVMKELASTNGGKVRIGDKEILIDDQDPLAAIKTFVDAGPLDSSTKVDQWLLVGGNARRNVTTTDGFPVGQPLWQVDLGASRTAQREVENNRETIAVDSSGSPKVSLVPANVPLIVDGLVLVGNKKQVSAVDFISGKRVWAVAGAGVDDLPGGEAPNPLFQRIQVRRGTSSFKTFDRSPWTDFLQGHASSDGKFIFHVVRSLAAPVEGQQVNRGFMLRTNVNSTTNTLQAIDMLKEGELAWEVGGGKTTGDPRLAAISFLGAPLPIDGVLYAIGKYLEEIVLVAVNSEDGKLVWLQALASSETTTRSRYLSRTNDKKHSLTPSFSKGILVCPTGKNALVAVDTIGRRVLWGAQTGADSSRSSGVVDLMQASQNPQVFVENSRVVALDVSKDCRLLAVSLLDGSPLMKIGKAGVKVENALYVASVDESRVVLVENTRVRAFSSDSGKPLWRTSIQKFGPPTGRGYVSADALYLPTEGNSIVKINLEDGKVVDGIYTDQPLGNLIVHQGRVISQRETSVSCYELDSKVMAELDAAAKAAGGIDRIAPALKIKQAAMFRNQGQIKEAVELLQTIAEGDRPARFKREFLRSATLLFESDPEFALSLFKEYESWFQFESDPEMFLGYVELLVKYGMGDDVIGHVFNNDLFFSHRETDADAASMQRPITGYNLDASKEGEPDQSEADQSEADQSEADQSEAEKTEAAKQADQDDSGDGDPAGKEMSMFLKSQTGFSKGQIVFGPNQWAKAQLIRIARNAPESVPSVKAAIEKRIASANLSDALLQHRFLRQFPLELVAPQLRFELAELLIARKHVAEAENLLASLLGFLPTSVEQIESAEISADGLSKDSFVELWSKIHDAQYAAQVRLAAEETPVVKRAAALDYDRVNVKAEIVASPDQINNLMVVQARGELASRLFKGKGLSVWGAEQEFEVVSPTGESETRFKMFESENDMLIRSGSGWIQTHHSLAILRHRELVLALDLSKLQLGREAVLWKRNVPVGSKLQVQDELDMIVNPALGPEDVTASFPTTGCCCFFDNDNLTCVDAFTGETLWARTRDGNHRTVLANGRQVVTMDAKLNERSVFDLRTGERLRSREVSNLAESLLGMDGVSFLAVGVAKQESLDELVEFEDYRPAIEDAKDGKKTAGSSGSTSGKVLSRYDASEGEFVWKKVFGSGAKISRLSGRRLVVLSPDNQLYFFDSKTGDELAKHPSGLTEDQRKKVRYIGGFEHLGKDLIVLADSRTSSISAKSFRIRAGLSQGTLFSGHIMALSQDTLEPAWDRLAHVDGFQLLPMLPSASPMLILTRKIQASSRSRGAMPQQGVQVVSGSSLQWLGIDMEDGHVVTNKIFGPVSTVRFTTSIVDLAAGTIEMKFAEWEVEFAFEKSSDEPPSPVASVTKLNPVPLVVDAAEADTKVAESKFDIEELNKRLVRQAEEYEASLEVKRKQERALLEKETSR